MLHCSGCPVFWELWGESIKWAAQTASQRVKLAFCSRDPLAGIHYKGCPTEAQRTTNDLRANMCQDNVTAGFGSKTDLAQTPFLPDLIAGLGAPYRAEVRLHAGSSHRLLTLRPRGVFANPTRFVTPH